MSDERYALGFSQAFKREAVDRVATGGLSAGAVARELRLHETVLRRMMQYGMERDISHLRGGLSMTFGFVDEHRGVWPVRVMCEVLGLSASGHHAWRTRPESR